jgi:hypothetical protein
MHLALNIFLLWLFKIFNLKHFKDCLNKPFQTSSSLIASCSLYVSPINATHPWKSNNNKTTQPRWTSHSLLQNYCAKLVSPTLLKNVARKKSLPRNNVTFSQIARNIGNWNCSYNLCLCLHLLKNEKIKKLQH